jgi:hypothetical protein
MTRNLVSSAVLAALVLAQAAPAFAQQSTRKPSKAGTILKWTLIGAGIGAGTGFWMGFRAYDDATFAERKIAHATMVSERDSRGHNDEPMEAIPASAPGVNSALHAVGRPRLAQQTCSCRGREPFDRIPQRGAGNRRTV